MVNTDTTLSTAIDAEEPLLKENLSRFVLFPIEYHDVKPIFVIYSQLSYLHELLT